MTLPKFQHIFLSAALFVSMVGCRNFNPQVALPWNANKKEELPQVEKMVAIWKDSTYYQAGAPPTRGFGGRIYFYDNTGTPVKVDGDIIVYAYDDTDEISADKPPKRKYVLTAEQLANHYSESSVGPSYSMWIPWDVVGGPKMKVQLIPTFKPKAGNIVVGAQTKEVLSGTVAPAFEQNSGSMFARFQQANQAPVQQTPVQQTAFGYAGDPAATSGQRRSTMTIDAPPSLTRRRQRNAYLPRQPAQQQTIPTSQSLDQPNVRTFQQRIGTSQRRFRTFLSAAEFFSANKNKQAATAEQTRGSRTLKSGQGLRSTGFQRPPRPVPSSPAFPRLYVDEPS